MHPAYEVFNRDEVFSPSLLFYPDLIQKNIARVIQIAGSPDKLRPHVKTHKTREIVRMEIEAGITKHKCATIAEAEMLAQSESPDVLIAYPVVGPNIQRLATLIKRYPATRFSALIDHPVAFDQLSNYLSRAGLQLDVLMDLNVGQNRTGIAVGKEALALYQQIARSSSLRPAGFQVYDGHNHQESLSDRKAAVESLLAPVLDLRVEVEKLGIPVPRIVCGGTPTFSVFAALDLPGLECSPGTFVLYDHGYGSKYADLTGFVPAAVLLTRIISRPTANLLTLDLGYKAVASDPPAGKRCVLLDFPEYIAVLQNEEHLTIETASANGWRPGDVVYALPTHVCPTCALHRQAYIVENNRVEGSWDIVARDRVLSI